MSSYLIKNANIVNEGEIFKGHVLIEDQKIARIIKGDLEENLSAEQVIDAEGKYLIPGVIDDQVHFRDPGLTHKADMYTESRAAVSGGTTSFMDMPNTKPQAITIDALNDKYEYAKDKVLANYSFYMGATNDNVEEILKVDPKNVCGVKVFMGASTGNMLVNNPETLEQIFAKAPCLIATHCEDEETIRAKTDEHRAKYGDEIPVECHPVVRDHDACYKSSSYAIGLAKKHNSRLHVLHLTTAKELEQFNNSMPLKEKRITAEVCVHHLWFCDEDYKAQGAKIKCNPAIKHKTDRDALRQALLDDVIDVIATDHAPHLMEEKNNSNYFKSPAGVPLVQHSLYLMLEFYKQGIISLEKIIQKMCHAPADCYQIDKRGYIREGYWADLVLVDVCGDNNSSSRPWTVSKDNLLCKCGWSPFEGMEFNSHVTSTWVNGNLVYENGKFNESHKGQRLVFNR